MRQKMAGGPGLAGIYQYIGEMHAKIVKSGLPATLRGCKGQEKGEDRTGGSIP